MRGFFAMLLAFFCWTAALSGQKLYAVQTVVTPTILNTQVFLDNYVISSYGHVYRPSNEIRLKFTEKRLLQLPRVHAYPCSLIASNQWVPAYTQATDLGYRLRFQWLPTVPAPNRLQQINWTLHSTQQQSRLGGWKESNILYRGSLTYHS